MRDFRAEKIVFADTLRGIAALLVVFGHYFGVFWFGRQIVATQANVPILPEAVETPSFAYWIMAPGYFNYPIFGVAVFFLVSGFVIPFSLRRLSAGPFLVGRFFRLFPTYAAGFTITLASLLFATWYFEQSWPYSLGAVFRQYLLGLRDLLKSENLDPVVWTLEVEVKFYIVCALSAGLFRVLSIKVFAVPVALFVASMLFWWLPFQNYLDGHALNILFVLASAAQYIIYMFIGVVFHYWFVGRIGTVQTILLSAVLFGMMLIVWSQARNSAPIAEFSWSYGYAIVAFFTLSRCERFMKGKVFGFFARISYPIYVVHCAFGYVSMRIMLDRSVPPGIALIVTSMAVIIISFAIHKFIEVPSHRFGRKISDRLVLRSTSSATRPI